MSIGCGAVVAAAIIVVVIAFSGGGPGLATRLPMIDVRTGEVHWVSAAKRAVSVPAPHPKSGERTLLGAELGPDGSWRILPQDLELLASVEGTISTRIDRSTGVVRSGSEGP